MVLVLALLPAGVALLSLRTAKDTAFALTANTDVLSVEPLCGQELIWDFELAEAAPSGTARPAVVESPARGAGVKPSASPPQRLVGAATVRLRGGARAVLERRPNGLWRIALTRGPLHKRCTDMAPLPSVVVSMMVPAEPDRTGPRPAGPSAEKVPLRELLLELPVSAEEGPHVLGLQTMRSAPTPAIGAPKANAKAKEKAEPEADAKPSGAVLLLSGRVVLGDLLRPGGGWSQASSPLLREGKLEARTRDLFTDRSVTVIDEPLDAGSRVDTHACLERDEELELLACLESTPVSASGFVYDNVDRALDVKLSVTTERIGIAQHGGGHRAVAITWWSRFISLQFVQMFAATLLLLCTLAQTLFALPAPTRPS